MKFEDLKVGQIVKANKNSNGIYGITKEGKGCVGKVIRINDTFKTFELEVTQYIHENIIGQSYPDLNPRYFDLVGEEGKIQINLKSKTDFEAEAGDFAVLENGKLILIARGLGGKGFRAVDMEVARTSGVWGTIERTLEDVKAEFASDIVRIIPSKNIEIIER